VDVQDFERNEFYFDAAPTATGQQALAALRRLVYRDTAEQQLALARCVFEGTLNQAYASRELCIAALVDSVTMHNCLSLMALADSCGCPELLQSCEECALKNFSTSVDSNADGLAILSEAQITRLLTHNDLHVESELEVYSALSVWVEHDLAERQSSFAKLFARVVRFNQLSHTDLVYLVEEAQLVALDKKALELAALSLIQRYMGVPHDDILGQTPSNGPRKCQSKHAAQDAAVQITDMTYLKSSRLRPLLEKEIKQTASRTSAAVPTVVFQINGLRHEPERAPKTAVKKAKAAYQQLQIHNDSNKENSVAAVVPSPGCHPGMVRPSAEMFLSPSRPQAVVALVSKDSLKRNPSEPQLPEAAGARRVLHW